MVKVNITVDEMNLKKPQVSQFRYIRKVMLGRWVVVGGLVIIIALVIVAIFAPLIAPYDPYQQDMRKILAPLRQTIGWVMMKSGEICSAG